MKHIGERELRKLRLIWQLPSQRFYNRSGCWCAGKKHPFFEHESYFRTGFYPMSGFTAMMDYITKEKVALKTPPVPKSAPGSSFSG
ncbi:MAG: hypothetical protein U0V75_18985 [Ferruginibacter sp.]